MPSNIFATTNTNVSIVFIDKTRTEEDEIILVDASKLGKKVKLEDGQRTILSLQDEKLIVDTFKQKNVLDEFSVVVNRDKIIKNKYSFSAGQYFNVKIKYNKLSSEEFRKTVEDLTESIYCLIDRGDALNKQLLELLKDIQDE